ncbi:MAG: DoxX family protein [Acidobacteriota bacterium]
MIPERYASQTYALMRIVFGFVFFVYGLQKWGMLGGQAVPTAAMIGGAKIIETVCGLLIMIGLFTKPAAFLASGEMAVAYFMIHQPNGGLPNQNMGERAVLFCFAFLYIATRGAGLWSADAAMKSDRR